MFLTEPRFSGAATFHGGLTFNEKLDRSLADTRAARTRRTQAHKTLWEATRDSQIYVENFNATEAARQEIYDRRIKAIHAATGAQLDNPYGRITLDQAMAARAGQADQGSATGRDDLVAEFDRQVDELAMRFPDQADLIRPSQTVDDEVRLLVAGAELDFQRAWQDAPAVTRWVSMLGGGISGLLRDPVQLSAMVMGGSAAPGRTAMARIAQVMATEAAINAGVEGVLQLRAQAWRAENGLEAGLDRALVQVGLAGLFGGTVGGLVQGGRELARSMKVTDPAAQGAIERAVSGQGTAKDLETMAVALGTDMDPADLRTARMADDAVADDAAAFGDAPDGIAVPAAERLAAQTARHADDPVAELPADLPAFAPARDESVTPVVDEARAVEADLTVEGLPVRFERFDPAEIGTDAAAYQYKDGGDAAGVTDRLRDVSRWDPTASGKVFVHEREDGRFVADGHQRLALARRLADGGEAGVALDGYLFRAADGWTVEDVRALAAKKNLQEGSGTALDAARVLRDRPDIMDDRMPVTGPMLKSASAMARLSDDAWGLVVNGVAAPHHAAAVGRLVHDHGRHAAILADVARMQPATVRETELLVREIDHAGIRHETQSDMFGSARVARTLMAERVKVLDETLKRLGRDKRLFAALADNAEVIEAAGNVLDDRGNVSRAATAEQIEGLIDRLARARGPVSDALTAAAERFADGSTAAREADAFAAQVQELFEQRGLRGLLEPEPAEVLKPAVAVEPATAEAGALAELAAREAGDVPVDDGATLWDAMPDGVDAEGRTRFTSLDDEIAGADALDDAADLIAACRE